MAEAKNIPRVINAWCMYDWANSVYSLTITTAIFPIYFNLTARAADGSDLIPFFWTIKPNAVVYTYALSLAFLIIAFLNPFLSSIADYGGKKKSFMRFFAYLGSGACMALFFFEGTNIYFGITCFMLATIGYAGSLVFYNAYLPEIVTPDLYEKVSAKGFSLGYIGSVLLLIFNLAMIQKPEWFFMSPGGTLPSRVSFLSVGIWWFAFSHYTFYYLPSNPYGKKREPGYLWKGFKEIKAVFRDLGHQHALKIFLLAFFFYSMGFQTIMYMASIFGADELKIPQAGLIITILIIQIVAIGGAYAFSSLALKYGNVKVLAGAAVICIFICVAAYFTRTEVQFYFLAVIVGLIMGGIQSLSRATYSRFLPATTDHASYFSFYEFCEKVGIVLGTASYGLITDFTGSMRYTIFALLIYFVLSLYFLLVISKRPFAAQPE